MTTAEETVKEQVQKMNELIKHSVIEIEQKPEKDHDFCWDVEPNQKQESVMAKNLKRKVKPYSRSRIKNEKFSYSGVKKEDFVDNNFTFDMITLLTKNINPFSLERKIVDVKIREIIYMLWDQCIERTFYKHICENDNFIYLNSKNVLYSKTAQIVFDYLKKDPKNIVLLRRCLQNRMKVIHFVYSKCFPEIYPLIDKCVMNLKSEFLLTFKLWKDKKKFAQPTSVISETENNKKAENDQDLEKTLVEVNDEKVSEKLNEKKLKRKVLAEKNTGLKEATKKCRKSGPTEKELWGRLDNLNKKFVQAKEHKKKQIKEKLNCIG